MVVFLLSLELEGTLDEVDGEAKQGEDACNVAHVVEGDAWKDGIQLSVAIPPLCGLHFLPPPVRRGKQPKEKKVSKTILLFIY